MHLWPGQKRQILQRIKKSSSWEKEITGPVMVTMLHCQLVWLVFIPSCPDNCPYNYQPWQLHLETHFTKIFWIVKGRNCPDSCRKGGEGGVVPQETVACELSKRESSWNHTHTHTHQCTSGFHPIHKHTQDTIPFSSKKQPILVKNIIGGNILHPSSSFLKIQKMIRERALQHSKYSSTNTTKHVSFIIM